jgi:hypothetical protein
MESLSESQYFGLGELLICQLSRRETGFRKNPAFDLVLAAEVERRIETRVS